MVESRYFVLVGNLLSNINKIDGAVKHPILHLVINRFFSLKLTKRLKKVKWTRLPFFIFSLPFYLVGIFAKLHNQAY